MQNHYSTDIEGGAPSSLRIEITGRIDSGAYLDFVAERARWLDLSGFVQAVGDSTISLVAAGPEALVGALEMACTLGPLDAVIETVETTKETGAVPPGFHVLR